MNQNTPDFFLSSLSSLSLSPWADPRGRRICSPLPGRAPPTASSPRLAPAPLLAQGVTRLPWAGPRHARPAGAVSWCRGGRHSPRCRERARGRGQSRPWSGCRGGRGTRSGGWRCACSRARPGMAEDDVAANAGEQKGIRN